MHVTDIVALVCTLALAGLLSAWLVPEQQVCRAAPRTYVAVCLGGQVAACMGSTRSVPMCDHDLQPLP